MPSLPGGSCRVPGCKNYSKPSLNGYCEVHKNKGWKDYQETKSSKVRIYQTTQWKKLVKAVWVIDNGLCRNCFSKGLIEPGSDVDHIKPKSQGGNDDLSNLQLLCKPCHKRKTATE